MMVTWCYVAALLFVVVSTIEFVTGGNGTAQSASAVAFWALARTYETEADR